MTKQKKCPDTLRDISAFQELESEMITRIIIILKF